MHIDRSNPPKIDGTISFHLQKFERFTLTNGMEILFFRKTNLPIINLHLIVNAGSKFDPNNRKGLAHLTTLLVDEGAGKYNSLELDAEIESLGSIFSVSTDPDNIHFNMLSLKENFERSFELLSLVYKSPTFSDEDFEREQKKLLAKILQNQDGPSFIASSNFDKIIFNGTNYESPISGDISGVSKITNSDVKNFHKTHFTPVNTKLVVVGNMEVTELKSLLKKYFNHETGKTTKHQIEIVPRKQSSKLYFIHKDNAAQSEIRIGHISEKRNETDYFAKLIVNSILGGQFSSRLNLNLREDKGYTYGIHSIFLYHKDAGHFEISTSVNGKDTAAAITEIQKEIVGLKKEIPDEEIEFTKSYMIKRFPALFETYIQITHNLFTMLKYNLSENYFDNYIDRINSCTKSEVEKAAKEKIKTEELIYLVVGDRETVLPQFKNITDLEIVELDVEGKIVEN